MINMFYLYKLVGFYCPSREAEIILCPIQFNLQSSSNLQFDKRHSALGTIDLL